MEKSVGSLAVRVINVLLTAHAVRACVGQYCPGAWSINTYMCVGNENALYKASKEGYFGRCTCQLFPTIYVPHPILVHVLTSK